jgi:hypothetical protein
MPPTVVFSADPHGLVHFPVRADAVATPFDTVVTTLCGQTGIGRVKDRRDANCRPCRACEEQAELLA